MTVRLGSSWSASHNANGGVPQGFILWVLLLNITTDNLEDPEEATGYTDPNIDDRNAEGGGGRTPTTSWTYVP